MRQGGKAQGGFTLLEILVVVLIIGIMVTFATISISGKAIDDRIEEEAQRLYHILQLAQEEAETKGVEIGFRQTDQGYEFLGIGEGGAWQRIDETLFRPRAITPPLRLELRVEGRVVAPVVESPDKETPIEPQVLLLSSGESTAFTLDVKADGVKPYFRIESDALGKLERKRQEDRS